MKYNALMYYGQKYFGFEELEMPACGENDMIVKNLTASICGSDTDTWLNGGELHYLPPRVEFGHEVVCEVVETGKNVTGVKPGDRIAPYPLKATPNPRKAGYLGGFSEYLYITNAKEDENFWILDERMSNKEAALIEPLSVSIHVADRANVTEKTIAVILGAGIIGAGVAVRLVDRGAAREHIVFVDRSQYRLDLLAKQGFAGVNSAEPGWQQKLIGLTGMAYCVYGPGSAADYIFDCAGSIDPIAIEPTLLEQAIRLLKFGGTMVLAGVHRRKVSLNLQKMVFGLQNMVCGSGATDPEFRIAIDMLNRKVIDFEALVTHSFAHKDAIEAIKFACDTNQCLKVQIDYSL